jgi:hypothetical protein
MNGGVLHAVECLSASELADAESGYRFFGFGAAADLLARARKIWEADQDLESYEPRLDKDYAALIPDDASLVERFEHLHKTRPSEFASV